MIILGGEACPTGARRLVLTCLCAALWVAPSRGDTIWSEDFESVTAGSGLDGTGALGDYPDGITGWTLQTNAAVLADANDYIKVVESGGNRCLQAQDVDGDAIWISDSIDLAAYHHTQFALTGYESGDHEADDCFDVEYALDGGAWLLIPDWNGQGSGTHTWITGAAGTADASDSSVAIVQAVTGSTLRIRVILHNSAGTERIQLDDIVVSGAPVVPAPTGITATLCHPSDFLLSWDLVPAATNYEVQIATDPTFPAYPGELVQINEVHADATGDVEFIELIAPAGTELAGYHLVHINGTDGGQIWNHTIGATTVPDDGIVDQQGRSLGFFVLGASGVAAADASLPGAIQNGDDAMLLYDPGGTLLDAIGWARPYTGTPPAGTLTNGPPSWSATLHSVPNDSATLSAQAPSALRHDSGDGWTIATPTPGALNAGQLSGAVLLQPRHDPILPAYNRRRCGAGDTLSVTNVAPLTPYYLRLRALTPGGTSAYSSTATVTTQPLSPGSIAFVAYNMDNPDRFRFIAVTNLPVDTSITFTDNAWDGATLGSSEGCARWDATAAVPAGTLITVSDGVASTGCLTGASLMLNGSDGDALLAYQTTGGVPAFVAALNVTTWAATGPEQLPATLTRGHDAIEVDPRGTPDNAFYNGSFALAPEALLQAIHTPGNWLMHSRVRLWPGESEVVPPPDPSCFRFR